ncbi:unnamed protein product [Rangifer tarandus platyrhynchus]|uniref:Uncharacterized protein n=1 Tax=Rangifer tarandus platyrhynchus TaxID=3082113 RepID=A0AC59ZXY5_RANTA
MAHILLAATSAHPNEREKRLRQLAEVLHGACAALEPHDPRLDSSRPGPAARRPADAAPAPHTATPGQHPPGLARGPEGFRHPKRPAVPAGAGGGWGGLRGVDLSVPSLPGPLQARPHFAARRTPPIPFAAQGHVALEVCGFGPRSLLWA